MENTIFVRNLSLFGIHGKDAITKGEKREFKFDIEVTIGDIGRAVQTEKLVHTFDYKIIIIEAEKAMNGEPCILIETLANRIANAILSYKFVEKIKLTLSKRELLHGAESGVTLIQEQKTHLGETL